MARFTRLTPGQVRHIIRNFHTTDQEDNSMQFNEAGAVVTETRAVRQDGESDIEFESRNFKVRASQAIHVWADKARHCETLDQYLVQAGLAARDRYSTTRRPSLGRLRGEKSEADFERWKESASRSLNQAARSNGFATPETRQIMRDVGLDPTVGVPEIREVTVTGTFSFPHSYEVDEGNENLSNGQVIDRLYNVVHYPHQNTGGQLTFELTPRDATTEAA